MNFISWLEWKSKEKDRLRVLFSSTLKYSHCVEEIVHKANRLLWLIKQSLDPQMLCNLYTALVRPHLDYTCVIWNPRQLGDISTSEWVQKSATQVCSSLRHLYSVPYNDQLVALNLQSLMYRRQRMDMIMMYNILHGLDGIPFDDLFSYHHTATKSNGYKLYKSFCRKYFFSQRIINDWNS